MVTNQPGFTSHSPMSAMDGLEVLSLNDLKLDRLNMLLYADFGQGKSTFAVTAPKPLFLSVESGESALIDMPHAIDRDAVEIVRIRSFDDIRRVYTGIITGYRNWNLAQSVIVDTLTELQVLALHEVMAREEKANPSKRQPGKAQMQDYGEVTTMMRRMLLRFRALPMHIIYTAHYRNDKSMDNPGGVGSRGVRAELTPALWKAVAGYVDILAYMVKVPMANAEGRYTGVDDYQMWLQDPAFLFSVKKRFRSLPPMISNPTFPMLLQIIEQSIPQQQQSGNMPGRV